MAELSPSAQAVLDAYDNSPLIDYDIGDRVAIAAVLRAAAEQISYKNELGLTPFGGHCQARDQILAIADELNRG